VRKELGTHPGTVKRKGKEVLEDMKDEIVYIPLYKTWKCCYKMMHSQLRYTTINCALGDCMYGSLVYT